MFTSEEIPIEQSSYQQGSSLEVLVEFGQPNNELINCTLIGSEIRGDFGVAEIFQNKGDKLVILDKEKHELKIIKKTYRGITIKNNRKKQPKNQDTKGIAMKGEGIDDEESGKQSSHNLFQSSQSQKQQAESKRKKKAQKSKQQKSSKKTRIIRKIRTLNKKKDE